MQTLIELGRTPELAAAEVAAVLGRHRRRTPVRRVAPRMLLLEEPLTPGLFSELGGSVRQAKLLTVLEARGGRLDEGALARLLASELGKQTTGSKLSVGFSVVGAGWSPARLLNLAKAVKRLYKHDQPEAQSLRFVLPEGREELSAKAVAKHQLIEGNVEFLLFLAGNQLFLGQTTQIQEVDDWAERDVGKVGRDAKKGMLPPKLARMMLNIALPEPLSSPKPRVLDPFCGTGTVLMEALLLGLPAIGLDSDPAQVALSEKNMAWLKRQQSNLPDVQIELGNATVLDNQPSLQASRPAVVVTEGYLGPALHAPLSRPQTQALQQQLLPLYQQFFASLAKMIRPGGCVVIALPCWRYGGIAELLLDDLKPLGYFIVNQFMYGRDDQFVHRDILTLRWR